MAVGCQLPKCINTGEPFVKQFSINTFFVNDCNLFLCGVQTYLESGLYLSIHVSPEQDMKGSLCTWPTPGRELPEKYSRQRSSSILTWTGYAPLME